MTSGAARCLFQTTVSVSAECVAVSKVYSSPFVSVSHTLDNKTEDEVTHSVPVVVVGLGNV